MWTEHLIWALPAKGERLYHVEMGPLSEKDADALAPRMADIFLKNVASLTVVPLAKMKTLERISIYGETIKLQNLDGIQRAKTLESVDVGDHEIVEIIPLGELRKLDYVCLSGNKKLADLTPLAACKELTLVRIDRTAVKDIMPLVDLPKLGEIDLKHSFSKKNKAAFQAKRPDVKL